MCSMRFLRIRFGFFLLGAAEVCELCFVLCVDGDLAEKRFRILTWVLVHLVNFLVVLPYGSFFLNYARFHKFLMRLRAYPPIRVWVRFLEFSMIMWYLNYFRFANLCFASVHLS